VKSHKELSDSLGLLAMLALVEALVQCAPSIMPYMLCLAQHQAVRLIVVAGSRLEISS
jgi:hypothetical protein